MTSEQTTVLKAEADAGGTNERGVLDSLNAGLLKNNDDVKPENRGLIELLDAWSEEDATEDPEELQRREVEWQALKSGLNANRAENGERPLFP
jgi:hypothetical protein